MKRIILLAASAMAILAGCTRTEIRSIADEPQQITFRTIETKAAGDFDKGNKFISYAWFLEKDKTWDANSADGQAYISGAQIAFDNDANAWKASGKTYYWPKQGSLTFFAWTDYTDAPEPTLAGCAKDKGITFTAYSAFDHKNKDLLVADIAKDMDGKNNLTTHPGWQSGVPTVFHHVLSNLVFTIKTDGDYSAGATYSLNSITLKNISTKGDYAQGSPAATADADVWTGHADPKEVPVFTAGAAGQSITSTLTKLTPSTTDFSIVLPQKFTNATPVIEIVYTITTNYTRTAVMETVTETKPLKDIYTEGWVSGKKYTLNIKLSLNEIYWDPSIEGWEDGAVTDIPF